MYIKQNSKFPKLIKMFANFASSMDEHLRKMKNKEIN